MQFQSPTSRILAYREQGIATTTIPSSDGNITYITGVEINGNAVSALIGNLD